MYKLILTGKVSNRHMGAQSSLTELGNAHTQYNFGGQMLLKLITRWLTMLYSKPGIAHSSDKMSFFGH